MQKLSDSALQGRENWSDKVFRGIAVAELTIEKLVCKKPGEGWSALACVMASSGFLFVWAWDSGDGKGLQK